MKKDNVTKQKKFHFLLKKIIQKRNFLICLIFLKFSYIVKKKIRIFRYRNLVLKTK